MHVVSYVDYVVIQIQSDLCTPTTDDLRQECKSNDILQMINILETKWSPFLYEPEKVQQELRGDLW